MTIVIKSAALLTASINARRNLRRRYGIKRTAERYLALRFFCFLGLRRIRRANLIARTLKLSHRALKSAADRRARSDRRDGGASRSRRFASGWRARSGESRDSEAGASEVTLETLEGLRGAGDLVAGRGRRASDRSASDGIASRSRFSNDDGGIARRRSDNLRLADRGSARGRSASRRARSDAGLQSGETSAEIRSAATSVIRSVVSGAPERRERTNAGNASGCATGDNRNGFRRRSGRCARRDAILSNCASSEGEDGNDRKKQGTAGHLE